MTYYDPQQPNQGPTGGQPGLPGGYPQQPDYGQQPPPQSGGHYPPPARDSYQQPQYGQQPATAWSGYGGPPAPSHKKNPLPWIIAAVVVAAGLVAGLVFALGGNDDKKVHVGQSGSPVPTSPTSGGRTSSTSTDSVPSSGSTDNTGVSTESAPTGPAGSPSDVSQQLVGAFNDHDLTALKTLACPSTTISVSQADLDTIDNSEITSGPDVTGATAVVNVDVTHLDSHTEHLAVKLAQGSGTWCVDSF